MRNNVTDAENMPYEKMITRTVISGGAGATATCKIMKRMTMVLDMDACNNLMV